MKKSLIALAVLAASGAASAQSSVSLYGIADAWVGSSKSQIAAGIGGVGGSTANAGLGLGASITQGAVNSGGLSSSRWGLRGTEDLGGGLKATFNLEQGIDVSNGLTGGGNAGTPMFDRAANLGVSGNFGTVKLGRMATPYYELRDATDAISTSGSSVGVARSTFSTVHREYAERTSNTVYYATPVYSGFSGAIAANYGEDKRAATATTPELNAQNGSSLHVKYANGPLLAGYAYQEERGRNAALTAETKAQYNLFAGSYNFGVAKAFASYQQAKFNQQTVNSGKGKDFQFGVSAPVAANVNVMAAYARAKFDAVGNGTDLKATGFTLASNYVLSKRTDVYAAYKQTQKKTDANGTDLGKDRLFGIGVRHRF